VESLITLFQHLTTAPESLNSAAEFLAAFGLLIAVALLLAVPAAILAKILLEKQMLGTLTRLRLAVGWTAVVFGVAVLIDALVLKVLDRVPHWTAVAPHCLLALTAGIWAMVQHRAVNSELKIMRKCVDEARREAA
jgi:protein-S-isoprenylcysteine O-methyltransferase Ste14